MAGGLLDIEFIAQFLVLQYGQSLSALVHAATRDVLESAVAEHALERTLAEHLLDAHALYTGVVQMQRLALPASIKPSHATANAQRLIASCVGYPDSSALSDAIRQHAHTVRAAFDRIIVSSSDRT